MAYGETDPAVGRRARILFLCIAAVGAFYSLVLWNLQIVRVKEFRGQSEANAVRSQPIRAGRGLILDRRGRVIAGNRGSFDILLDMEDLDAEARDATLRALAPILEMEIAEIQARLERWPSPHRPALLAEDVAFSQVARVEAHRLEHPHVRVRPTHRRQYAWGQTGAHLLGYIGEISQQQLDRDRLSDRRAGDLAGKSGLELYYDRLMTGTNGTRTAVVNAVGQEIEGFIAEEPVIGSTLRLTLDLDLQRAAEEAMADKVGAAVVLDPRSGAVLALVSHPSFDPNLFSGRLTRESWASLTAHGEDPLHNRAIQSSFSPGSTFKILLTIAALEEKVITPETTFYCPGGAKIHGQWRRCWKPGGHGHVDLHEAIRSSCNVYFYRVGEALGIERIARWARAFGYGSTAGLDLPGESAGNVPDPAWKRRVYGETWWPGETVSVAIGQGALEVTPLQQAILAAAVANGGKIYRPYLVSSVEDNARPERRMEAAPSLVRRISLRPETLETVRQGMWAVVHEPGGTARSARVTGRDVCGKTGTAQVHKGSVGMDNKDMEYELRDHAWFIGFAPAEEPQLAWAIFVEHGGHGGTAAAPVARRLVETWYAGLTPRGDEPLPAPVEVSACLMAEGGR